MLKSRFFIIPLAIIFIFCYPIISADVLYRDDVARSVYSFAAWDGLGRPLADFVMHLFSLNFDLLPNSAPLPLLVGIIIAASTIYYVCNNNKNQADSTAVCVMLTLIFVSPFFIQNIAFQFDSFTMIFANSLCILSFFIFDNKSYKKILISFASLFSCLSLYQPCANIFIALIAYNALFGDGSKKTTHTIFLFFITYISYYIMMFVVMKYGADGRSTLIDIRAVPEALIDSVIKVLSYAKSVGHLFSITVIIGAIAYIYFYIKNFKKLLSASTSEKIINILSPLALVLSLSGPLFLLKEGIAEIRVLPGSAAAIAVILYSIYKVIGEKAFIIASAIILFITISISFQFSNIIKEQRKYEEFVMAMAADDLGRMNYKGEVYIHGRAYDSPTTWKMLEATPFLKHVYSPALPWISVSMMQQLSVNNLASLTKTVESDKLSYACSMQIPPVIETRYYKIFTINDDIILFYGNNPCG